ncbi:MAG: DinB family protein [Flavobacteriales bacterium]|nr:DinB family protein [Flavobacteriales bacterium]
MLHLLREYAAYNEWANGRFVQRLAGGPDDVLDRHVPSSFPTLRATVLHIRDAEHTWWCRLTGAPVRWPAEESTDIASLMPHTRRLRTYVEALTADDLQRPCTYHDLRGNAHEQLPWRMLMHCFNHGTQHRGQLITMMRAMGLGDIPANDLVRFQREQARLPGR